MAFQLRLLGPVPVARCARRCGSTAKTLSYIKLSTKPSTQAYFDKFLITQSAQTSIYGEQVQLVPNRQSGRTDILRLKFVAS